MYAPVKSRSVARSQSRRLELRILYAVKLTHVQGENDVTVPRIIVKLAEMGELRSR